MFVKHVFGLLCLLTAVFEKSKSVFAGRTLSDISLSLPSNDIETKRVRVSNLNETCIRCLCHVTGCDLSHKCSDGYCGPFYISRVYWVDAGKPTLPDDDPNRKEAFEDCARDYHCSIRIIENYMAAFGKDCNNDGVTNCFDYMMINYHGGRACSEPLFVTALGRRRLGLYQECRFD